MRSHPATQLEPASFIDQMHDIGWGVLAEVPVERSSWAPSRSRGWPTWCSARCRPGVRGVSRSELREDRLDLSCRSRGPGESVFRTETRAVATDPVARAKFRRYWSLVSPGIIMIRWMLLGPLKADAERHAEARRATVKAGG